MKQNDDNSRSAADAMNDGPDQKADQVGASGLKREVDARAKGTRQKIVAAAVAEFAAHGLEGARIDQIAKSAMVNKAMIYYHFDSKELLYKEVLVSYYRDVRERVEPSVRDIDSLDELLPVLAGIHAHVVLGNPEIVPLVLREMASPHPDVIQAIGETFAASGLPSRVIDLLRRGAEDGTYKDIDPRHAMAAFIGMSLGYIAFAPLLDHFLGIKDRREFLRARPPIIVDIFLNGLKVR